MPRGRKPMPTARAEVLNFPGKRRRNAREPKPAAVAALPEPPSHLSDEAKAEWGRRGPELVRQGILTALDTATFAAYCQAWGRWVQADEALNRIARSDELTRGLVMKTTNGNVIHSPFLGIANKAMADAVRYAAELGMTPSSRTRLAAAPADDAGDDGYGF
ncbi:MAG: phage terminase small subunit P27 family [Azospirillum sp.]|nr:phage terminase small subunit P27 family [Azospirillum sp.]